MDHKGLIDVDPATAFLSRLHSNDQEINSIPGAAVSITYEGDHVFYIIHAYNIIYMHIYTCVHAHLHVYIIHAHNI